MDNLDYLKNDLEKAEYFQNIVISHATGGASDDKEYKEFRTYFLQRPDYEKLLPDYIRTKRDLNQFWNFIKYKFKTYAERREFIWKSFVDLFNFIESHTVNTISDSISNNKILKFGVNNIHLEIQKGLERINNDPEGAVTLARTILESTCKYIADQENINYTENTDLSVLYKDVSKKLNLSPDQHNEEIFKQILGGCSGIINGLGTLRNRLGDAHGRSIKNVKPLPRHAELAVNLAGSMSIFLIETYESNKINF